MHLILHVCLSVSECVHVGALLQQFLLTYAKLFLKLRIKITANITLLCTEYKAAFEHQTYTDEMEPDNLVKYFSNCDLQPTNEEIEKAKAIVLRGKMACYLIIVLTYVEDVMVLLYHYNIKIIKL